jgi:4-amino-4-deoxy-L-arabinose transferase-like glycosyltransferase
MGYVALLVGSLLALGTGASVALCLRLSRLERVLAAALVAYTQVIVTLLIAGPIFHSFGRVTVLAVNVVVTGMVIVVLSQRFGLGDAVRSARRTLRATRVPPRLSHELRYLWAWVLGALAAVEVVYLYVVAYILPPATWDALTYHLPAVAAWIRAGNLVTTPLSVAASADPMNGELGFLWIGALTRSDLLVDAAQIPFAILGAVAVMSIGRTVGLSKTSAIVAGFLYFLTPIVLAQATANYVDVVLPGLFLTGFAFLLRAVVDLHRAGGGAWPGRRAVSLLALAGLGLGLAMGSKGLGLLYAGVAGLVLLGNLIWARRTHRVNGLRAVRAFLVVVAIVFVAGSFWYIRTWINWGDPFYPARIEVAGLTLGTGPLRLSHLSSLPTSLAGSTPAVRIAKSWLNQAHTVAYDQRLGGFGSLWPALEIPALIAFAALLIVRRRWLIILNFLVPFGLIFLLTPDKWWSRFTVFLVVPGVVALVYVIEQLRVRWLRGALQAVTVLLAVSACAFTLTRTSVLNHTFPPKTLAKMVTKSADERTLSALVLPEFRWTEQVPRNSRIGADRNDVPFFFVYGLYGSDFRNDVIALPAELSNPTALRRMEQLDYVFTRAGSRVDRLALAHPGTFIQSSKFGVTRVYKVR